VMTPPTPPPLLKPPLPEVAIPAAPDAGMPPGVLPARPPALAALGVPPSSADEHASTKPLANKQTTRDELMGSK
jgi:hypothetical protein